MIIKKMLLNNFTSFYGKHVFEFQEGLNLIVGSGGSGKTNLARAFRFAVLGQSDFPRGILINSQYRKECLEKGENPCSQVEVEIEHRDADCLVRGELSLIRKMEIRQFLTVNSEIDNIITSKTFKLIYLDPLSLSSEGQCDTNLPRAVHMTQKIIQHLRLNVKSNIKMAFLDGLLSLMSDELRKNLLNYIVNSGLEQTIVMEKWALSNLQDYQFKIHNLDLDRDNLSSKFTG